MPTDHFVIPKYRTLIPHHVKREQYTKTKPKQTFQENANNINSFKKVAILISCSNKLKIILFGGARLAAGMSETLVLTTDRASFIIIQLKNVIHRVHSSS